MSFEYKTIDLFGIGIGLRYMNREQFQSKFGAIISLIIGILISTQAFIVGQELYFRSNPEVIFSERYVASPKRFNLQKDTFNFAFGNQFPGNYSHFIDDSIYSVFVQQTSMQRVLNVTTLQYEQVWSSTTIPAKPCKKSDFGVAETKNYFQKLQGIEQMYCLEQQEDNLFIEGNFDQDQYSFIKIKLQLCTGKDYCRPKSEIKEILTNSYLAFYSNDLIINPKLEDPFEKVAIDRFWNVSPDVAKDVNLFFRNIYLGSDTGLLFEDKNSFNSTSLSYSNEQVRILFFKLLNQIFNTADTNLTINIYAYFFFKLAFGEQNFYFSLTLRFEKFKESIYHRKYKKLQNVFAEIGGIAKALMILGFLICIPINKLSLHSQLSNTLFSFNIEPHPQIEVHRECEQTENLNQEINKEPSMRKKVYSVQSTFQKVGKSHIQQTKILPQTTETELTKIALGNPRNFLIPHKLVRKSISKLTDIPQNQESNIPSTSRISYSPMKRIGKNLIRILSIKKQLKKNIQNKRSEENSQIQTQKNPNQMQSIETTKLNSNSDKIQKIFSDSEKEEEQKLNFKWTDYFRYYFWPFGKFQMKKKQIQYSVEKIYQHFDMLFIIRKLLELERLKSILLDEDQIQLIQFLPKPLIDVNEIESHKNQINNHLKQHNLQKQKVNMLNDVSLLTDKEKAKAAFSALQNILKKESLTNLDKKIIEMLDGQIIENISNHIEHSNDLNYFGEQINFNLPSSSLPVLGFPDSTCQILTPPFLDCVGERKEIEGNTNEEINQIQKKLIEKDQSNQNSFSSGNENIEENVQFDFQSDQEFKKQIPASNYFLQQYKFNEQIQQKTKMQLKK